MFGFETTFCDLPSDQTGLLRWLASSLTTDDRHGIAACDYGDQIAEHRAAIDEILRSGRIVDRFNWVPGEVFVLTRWIQIDADDVSERALTHHRQRLFATAALMAQLTIDPLDEDATEDTLFGFVDSAIALGQQPRALGMLRWITDGLEAQVAIEAELAKKNGEDDFELMDVTGREVAYLPLAILVLDRSREQPVLSSHAVMAAIALSKTLDCSYLEGGASPPQAAFFNDSSEGMREKEWRALLRAAILRERTRGTAAQQDLDGDAATALIEWWELALATGRR